jgi:hypothetical protein
MTSIKVTEEMLDSSSAPPAVAGKVSLKARNASILPPIPHNDPINKPRGYNNLNSLNSDGKR